jgi:hypothetical protein
VIERSEDTDHLTSVHIVPQVLWAVKSGKPKCNKSVTGQDFPGDLAYSGNDLTSRCWRRRRACGFGWGAGRPRRGERDLVEADHGPAPAIDCYPNAGTQVFG